MTGWPLWWRLLLISGLWGGCFPLIRWIVQRMDPAWLAGARGLLAAAAMAAFLAVRNRGALPHGGMVRHALVLGTVNGWIPNLLIAASLARIESATGALVQAAAPLMVAALSALVLPAERPGPRALFGLALGFAGIGVVVGPGALGGGGTVLGALLMLAVAFSYATGTVYTRWARPGAAEGLVLGQQLVSGIVATAIAPLLAPAGPPAGPPLLWAAVLLLAVLGSAVPLTLFLSLVQRARATDATMVGYLQPVFAAVFGALLLAEWPEPRVLAGGAVVLAGVWLATRR